jgi:hypothetical protein
MGVVVNSCSKGADNHQSKNQVKADLRKIRKRERIRMGGVKRRYFPEVRRTVRIFNSFGSGFSMAAPYNHVGREVACTRSSMPDFKQPFPLIAATTSQAYSPIFQASRVC